MTHFEEEEDFDQEEFKRISQLAMKQTRAFIKKKIAENEDPRRKHVGDSVLIWDGSRLTDYISGEIEYTPAVQQTVAETPSIVIETGNKYRAELTTFAGDFSKVLDLVVWNKKLDRKFRTSSDFVRLK